MTIFTTMSAFRNIDQGDRSLGNEPILSERSVAVDPLRSPGWGRWRCRLVVHRARDGWRG